MQEQQLFSPDGATVAALVADLEALADQVDSLSERAKAELGQKPSVSGASIRSRSPTSSPPRLANGPTGSAPSTSGNFAAVGR